MGDCLRTGKSSRYITNTKVNLASLWVGKSSTGLHGWGKAGCVHLCWVRVTLCDPIWQVTLCSSAMGFQSTKSYTHLYLFKTCWCMDGACAGKSRHHSRSTEGDCTLSYGTQDGSKRTSCYHGWFRHTFCFHLYLAWQQLVWCKTKTKTESTACRQAQPLFGMWFTLPLSMHFCDQRHNR